MAERDLVLDLTDPAARERSLTGTKAAVLATLAQAGFAVPDGCVITTAAFAADEAGPARLGAAIGAASDRYDGVRVAVRSSGVAEDLAGASFAGQYETILDVQGLEGIADAVGRCRASADGALVREYRLGAGQRRDLAVLVQRQVEPRVSGVAFGADPITGDRATVLVSAVRGSCAPLVSGQVEGEDWEVTGPTASCRRGGGEVLRPDEARSVAGLLRRIEQVLGGPLDMEWALAGGQLWVLQARPMTMVPDPVSWTAPPRGGWFRGIRLGEWLPEPVTPLCDSWLLTRLEERVRLLQRAEGGIRAPAPLHVLVAGWYFHSPIGTAGSGALLAGLARRPRLAVATVIGTRRPVLADKMYFAARARGWRAQVLEPYQRLVAIAGERADSAGPGELMRTIDGVADAAGDFLWSLVTLGGAAWRSEVALARFHHRHLRSTGLPYQALLGGLTPPPRLDHAVQSLDWVRPTLAELAEGGRPEPAPERLNQVAAQREAAERACRELLAPLPPRYLARFESLLDVAQRHVVVRWELSEWFTLGWPVLRAGVRRLGQAVHEAGLLEQPDDVFFLTRTELRAGLDAAPPAGIAGTALARRAEWERQRRLSPPLAVGQPPFLLARFLLSVPRFLRAEPRTAHGDLSGIAASPGTATGPVRVLRDGTAVASVRSGDVLVVPTVVPALTPLFDRIAAICAESGSVAAHTSIVAREYGIPSVTGLGQAVWQLTDGDVVTVDGSAGRVVIR